MRIFPALDGAQRGVRRTSSLLRYAILLLFTGLFAISCSTRKKIKSPSVPVLPPTIMETPDREYPIQTEEADAIRGVWLTTIYGLDWPSQRATSSSDMARQRQELCRILDRLAASHFNTVFFQVRHRGDVIYPSDIEPRVTVFTGGRNNYLDYDPLRFAIEECHKRGLSIHAWVVTFPLGNNSHVASLGSHSVWQKHRDWCFTLHNDWYLNPGHPEARSYISSVVCEMVQRYDLDGVHFDYVRYPDKTDKLNDNNLYYRYGKGKSLKEWRTGNITAFLKEVSTKVHAIKPYMLVSAAPLGKLRVLPSKPNVGWTARESVYQDPAIWHREGAVDFVAPMMYYRNDLFDPYLADWREQIPGLPIVPGLAPYRLEDESNWSSRDIDNQMRMSKQLGAAGICFYREQNIRPNRKGVDRIIAQHFTAPVRMPAFAHRGSTRPPKPTNLRVATMGNFVTLSWNMPSSWTAQSGTFNLYATPLTENGSTGGDFLLATLIPTREYRLAMSALPRSPKSGTRWAFRIEASSRTYVRGTASDVALWVQP